MPLPPLKTMLEICSDARSDLRDAIKRDPELADLRWHADRGCMLFAISADGERLNDEGMTWTPRAKAKVVQLLEAYPQAVSIIADSGINLAANREEMDASNYVPHFWQATIWQADRQVYSDAGIDFLIRTTTAFRSMADLLNAKGSYRPSLDCSDPVMMAIADRYDRLQEFRGDHRRAYRYRMPK